MRPVLVVLGAIVFLMGLAFALQGAYLIPATFMRGPEWIAIGAVIAVAGLVLLVLGVRRTSQAKGT